MVTMTDACQAEDTSTYLILDQTGETDIDSNVLQFTVPEPKKDKVRGEESGTSEEVVSTEGESFETVEENLDHSNSSSDNSLMRSSMVLRSNVGDGTPSLASLRRTPRGKRKRRQSLTIPVLPKRAKPGTPGTPGMLTAKKKNRNKRKKKKSVILIDSDSEVDETSPIPDISVIEIDDETESVIVLSDDEIGVCSGSLSTTKKPLQPRNLQNPLQPINLLNPQLPKATAEPQTAKTLTGPSKPLASASSPIKKQTPLVIEDLTGNYISQKPPEPQPNDHFEMYCPPGNNTEKKTGLRPIVIDGCNVAFGHGRDRFSSLGLKICIDYFKNMGHEVVAFVPQFRKSHSATLDPQILDALEKDGTLSFTPSRRADGKMIVSYDDRFIVQYADQKGGIIVSRDNYRDLLVESPEYKETIHKRLLMFTWVGDTIMFPKDPLGRTGPTLQEFLKF